MQAAVFLRDLSVHMNGFANVQPFMWEVQRMIVEGTVDPTRFFTHHFQLNETDKAFRVFGEKEDGVLKVMIHP